MSGDSLDSRVSHYHSKTSNCREQKDTDITSLFTYIFPHVPDFVMGRPSPGSGCGRDRRGGQESDGSRGKCDASLVYEAFVRRLPRAFCRG